MTRHSSHDPGDPALDELLARLPDPPLAAAVDAGTHTRALAELARASRPARAPGRRLFDSLLGCGLTGLAAVHLVWAVLSVLALYR